MSIPIIATEYDLCLIGSHKRINKNGGGTKFIFSSYTEFIIVRSILNKLGYKIEQLKLYFKSEQKYSIDTSYPWDKFQEIKDRVDNALEVDSDF